MQMVFEPGGTAVYSRINGINICGKTGTAQNPHGKDHSIFTAFAPRENHRIAIAVVVENTGYGSTWAGPIASLMIEKYLRDSISRPDYYLDRLLDANMIPEKKKVATNAKTVQNKTTNNRNTI